MTAEIRRLDLIVNGVEMELVHADVWDPPDGDDERATVYYEDEERPDDAVPLYRLRAVLR